MEELFSLKATSDMKEEAVIASFPPWVLKCSKKVWSGIVTNFPLSVAFTRPV